MHTLTTIHPELLTFSAAQLAVLSPYMWVFGGTIVGMLVAVVKFMNPKWPIFILTIAISIMGIVASAGLMADQPMSLFNDMMVSDSYSNFFNIVFMASLLFTTLASFRYLDREKLQFPEYYLLMLFAALGMMLMVAATDLIVFFIAFELMSLTIYTLVGFRRSDRRSNEAAMKYFILGSASSAVLLYGTALLYGATGTTSIHPIMLFIQTHSSGAGLSPIGVLGIWLVSLGFLFKIASVPFHMWMPDVYEGAPTPITGFMTTGLKAAAFASFVRIFISMGYGKGLTEVVQSHIHDILWFSAVATMLVGNLVALTQTNLKRMLAYSSIAHTGYLLVGIIAAPNSELGWAPVVMYLVTYAAMNLGAFVILTILSTREDTGLNLSDLAGLSRRHPWLSLSMGVFMFSMAGVPPTAGFIGKYQIFYGAVQAHETFLVVLAVLCSCISVYYYLRVLVYLYMHDPVGSPSATRVSAWSSLAVAAMVAVTLQVGVLPAKMVDAAKRAVTSL
jgi:NADH-quinone oxidoreductase subunit N